MSITIKAALLAVALATPGAAAALPPIEKNPVVVQGFYAIGLADEIRKNCPTISPRLIRAWSYLNSLKSYAREAGYSEQQIDALQHAKAAKNALEDRIRADLAARGATPANPEGYCAVGREEIARDTAAGRLLRSK
ncbi:DUF5333 domain-containing protein [Tranquillimonas alkanivorans]|uniref:DUF5333 domain-containing protein n=1 Tax=Tranquillimonas alkanivorans TaxID=441119 RepID=A0A1I5SI09_9RHOB|nr:DUF5333 domain-containing protein [Tranquillimonas alkanivorans]SFP70349.1 hypothetical protein SAMN04488047_11126 [Tranquillimonas alkanivorans]